MVVFAFANSFTVSEKLFWSLNKPPRPRLSLEREFYLMARPPLLCQGGESTPPKRSARLNAYTSQRPSTFMSTSPWRNGCQVRGAVIEAVKRTKDVPDEN